MAFPGLTDIPSASKRLNQMVHVTRLYMRDHPHLNRLIRGQESDDRIIAWALIDTLDDFNSTPPFLGAVGLTNFPSMNLLRLGTVATLLESVAILQIRNQLSFSDGGISIAVSDKAPLLMNFSQMLRGRYEQQRDRIKASQNIEMAMEGSGHFSEYFVVNGLYLDL